MMAHPKADPGVDAFFQKDFPWKAELEVLRALCLDAGLEETLKWKQPCYCVDGRNVLVLQAFKHYCALGFFKGVLYRDPGHLLEVPTENSQSARRMSFVNVANIHERREDILAMLAEGKRVETAGERFVFKETGAFEMSAELEEALAEDSAFAEDFRTLTPGRQRGYILYFSGASPPRDPLASHVTAIGHWQARDDRTGSPEIGLWKLHPMEKFSPLVFSFEI